MDIKLTFLGAAQNVTGSRYLVETEGLKLLVDCGMYQEREFRGRDWAPFPVPPNTLDAVLLTHAHLDHCGMLPKLVAEGFRGRIYCTAATAEVARIVLLDSAHIQEEDASFKKRRHEREGRKGPHPEVALYDVQDALATLPHFSPVRYDQDVSLGRGVSASFHDAGHVLGSAMVRLTVAGQGGERVVLFSGDVGRWGRPILRDPTLFDAADYVLVESTYGDRLHEGTDQIDEQLAEVITSTLRRGGTIVVPSFAFERAQELLYYMNQLRMEGRIPRLHVYLDSPMANSITEVFEHHPELFDKEMLQLLRQKKSPFEFPGLEFLRTMEESRAADRVPGGAMIIAGSGMCTGGRIKHHLFSNISRPESTVLFVGYQAAGTLGREIVDGAKEVRILGQTHPVRARVAQIHGFSAHADRDELFRWLSGLQRAPRHVFVTHGEPEAAYHFAKFLKQRTGWETSVPGYGDEVPLN